MQRLTYANVMSTIAVFLALGGTSYAVASLPKNSVGDRQLKKNAVTSTKLADAAVTGAKVQDGSIAAADLAPGTATSGPRGARGAEGAKGDRGPSDIYTTTQGGGELSKTSGQHVDVGRLRVPAGKWLFTANASLIYGGTYSDWFRCSLAFGTQAGRAGAVIRLGSEANGTLAGFLSVQEGIELPAETEVRLHCGHDAGLVDGSRVEHVQITAIRTDNLQIQ